MTPTRSLRVLMYHRIAQPKSSAHNPSTISATPAGFADQMRLLAEHYRVVSSAEVLDAIDGRYPLPPDAVLITFDDGCRDFAETAWPILKRCGLPATLFVPTAFPDDPCRVFWWDRLYRAFTVTKETTIDSPCGPLPLHSSAARRSSLRQVQQFLKAIPHDDAVALAERLCIALGYVETVRSDVLTWTELRQLASEGVALGAHTHTHPALTRLPREQAREEIRRSRDELTRRLGAAPRVFAYPFGDFDDRVVRMVSEEGFSMALTCRDGHNRMPGADPLRLCRTNVTTRTTPFVFRIRLTRAGARLDQWRHGDRGRSPSRHDLPVAGAPAQDRGGPKVAYIMSRFPKLSETFVLNEMRAVASLGLAVEVYPLRRERQSVKHPEAAEWACRAHFHSLLSFRTLRAQTHFLMHQPWTYVRLYAQVLRETWGGRPKAFVGAAITFPRAVRFAADMQRRGVTHVHAHFANHPTVAAYVVHRLTGIPFSFTAHGSDLHVDRRMLDTKVAAASFVVTVSNFNKQIIVESCGAHAADKVHVIHCGVDPDVFAPPAGERCRTPFRIVCVASFEEVKGHCYLVEACRTLRDRGVDFRCDLVGQGPLVETIRAQIARAALGGRVRVLGGQPRPEVARMLAHAGAAVLASHPTPQGKREGVPVALMEAMSCGTPVVATAISGIPELVESGRTGFLVPSGNASLLAAALELLIGDPELCDRLGQGGRRKVRNEFNLHASAARLMELFHADPVSKAGCAAPASAAGSG